MKNLIFISVLLLLGLGSKAQNTEFAENSFNIFLKSGKLIKNVKLWKIDTFKVEYVSNGNLADVNTYEVLDIETPEYYLIFDSSNNYIKNFWDTIIEYNNEFLKGRIVIIDSFYITFFPYNKNKTSKINYKSYKINNSNPASVLIINSKR